MIMVNEKVIERLKKGNWVIDVKNPDEAYKVINKAEQAGLDISTLSEIVRFILSLDNSNLGNARDDGKRVYYNYSSEIIDELGVENITEWFFKNVNGDEVERDNLHKILDAWLDGKEIEFSIDGIDWEKLTFHYGYFQIHKNSQYRIKPKTTPLPIPDELWKFINPELNFAAMDKNGSVYVYGVSPSIAYNDRWVAESEKYGSLQAFNINTDGIDWRLSLTERPEGL